jgi:serine protease Do
MSNQETPNRMARIGRGRLALLASVASIGLVVAAAGTVPKGSVPAYISAAQADGASQHSQGFADLVDKVKPAVISVRVNLAGGAKTASLDQGDMLPFGRNQGNAAPFGQNSPFERFFRQFGFQNQPNVPNVAPRQHLAAEGSGFFVSADGYAVTNNHVVNNATSVQVVTNDGKTLDAKVVGTDPLTDLALIKVEGDHFPFVKFADHDPRIGDWVIAVGNPFGLGGTVTAGIISARGRDIGSGPYNDFIQIDAPMNRGNSGGPSFDMDGNVIGVNTAIYSPSGGSVGIGFDIPAATAKMVVAQLEQKGHVTRGWMGVRVQTVTGDIANGLGMKKAEGAIVDEPQAGSPAEKAGLKAGDVITAVDGKDVKDSRALAQMISGVTPGTTVKLDVWQDGHDKTMSLKLGELPNERQANAETGQQGSATASPRLGLTLAPASDVAGAGSDGVAVTAVDSDSPAAEHGVATGDVILDVGGKKVSKPADVRQALTDLTKEGKHTVLMRVKSNDGTKFVAVPLGKA